MLKTENLTIKYGDKAVIKDLNLTVNNGEILGITGESGSGKTALLKGLIVLEDTMLGKIFLDDIELTSPHTKITSMRQKIGAVFHDFSMFNHMTVIENIMSGLIHIKHEDPQLAYEKAMKLLDLVSLSDRALKYPDQISSGHKQMIAVARALAMDPDVLIMDEPTTLLDQAEKERLIDILKSLSDKGKIIIFTSKDTAFIQAICTRTIHLKNGIIES